MATPTPWTEESAILRDLSFAQGRWVPGDIDAAITVTGGKPPTHNITEETEEEYFRHWTTDGDFSSGPDLVRIKKMLELVHDEDLPQEDFHTGPIQISKLRPTASMFVAKRKAVAKENKPNKPRRARNVAIASILALANQLATENPSEPLKLSKPEDFIKPKPDNESREHENVRKDSVNKVTNWLQSQDITSMFKKKSSVSSLKDSEQNITESASTSKIQNSPVQSEGIKSPQNGQYTPSKWATEYYRKAVNRSHMRDLVREDVWSRAEKIMKDIDAQKAEALRKQQEEDEALAAAMAAAEAETDGTKLEAAETSANTTNTDLNDSNPEASGIAYVLLPKSRHDLSKCDHTTCVVCKALTVPSGQSNPNKNNGTPKELISDSDNESFDSPDSPEKTESKDSSDASDDVNRYFGLVRTSLVENLNQSVSGEYAYNSGIGSVEEGI